MTDFKQLLHGARLIGVGNAWRSIVSAYRRDRLDARYPKPYDTTTHRVPGELRSADALVSGAHFVFEGNQLTVRFLAPDLVFIGWDGAEMKPSYAVTRFDWSPVETSLEETPAGWRLRGPELYVEISHQGELRWFTLDDRLLHQEAPPQPKGYGWQVSAPLSPEACVYGLGERAASLNLRPGKYRLWNRSPGGKYGPGADPLYICMPLYFCQDAQGSRLVFYDNSFDGAAEIGDALTLTFTGGSLRGYLAFGNPQNLLERLSELTGSAPLPPRWALGYHQSKWGYRTQARMQNVFQGFQQRRLPLSVLTLDADFMSGYRTMTADPHRYPDLPGFAEQVAQAGVHLVGSVNPGVKREPGLALYETGQEANVYCLTPGGEPAVAVVWPGYVVYPDFTHPQVRQWWGEQYAGLLDRGLSGFWHDMNEPECFVAWGEATLPRCIRFYLDGQGGDHRQAHNIFGLQVNRAGYEGLRSLRPENRPFILSRSGWVGVQRYAWTWTADVETSWRMLRQTIATVLGLGLCGVPYSGPDIGGFTGAPSPELFVRWFQIASFLPFFRTHCAFYLPGREPWEFGEQVLEILRSHLEQRYRLLPYWYTLAWESSQTGHPLVRPLFWDDPQDRSLWAVDDAFLVGEALLVAPVVAEGITKRSLTLPKGRWYELGGNSLHIGGVSIQLDAPLERTPVLVRAGSILPSAVGDHLTLHLYRPLDGDSGSGQLFSDTGDGYGPYRLDRFKLEPLKRGGYAFSWTCEGDYPWPYRSAALQLHGFGIQAVSVAGQRVPFQKGQFLVEPLTQAVIE
jgi:alpha-glucosidase